MKRLKIGDVLCARTENGLKIFQYFCVTKSLGQIIRVLPGVFVNVSSNYADLVESEHEYLIAFDIGRALKFGFCEFLGQASIPTHAAEPDYFLGYTNVGSVGTWRIDSLNTNEFDRIIGPPDVACLPEKYKLRNFTLGYVGPDWLMYLFECNFDLHHMDKFWPGKKIDKYSEKYTNMFTKPNK